jgi:putative tricarboxylic transport membrane protein
VPESFTALIAGLQHLFALPTFLYLVAGSVIGFVVGVLPGLGGPATMALLLPALLQVAPLDACVLITAVAAVSAAAGDLTSILLGVPGEATAAAVVPDGHALALQGHGGRALGAAITSALLGSFFGAIVLVTFVPVARPLINYMQSPELAALAILGICLLIPLSRADAVRGFLSGALGLSLATVGLDPSLGEPRFTFGQLTLWDGLGLLPMALGIYAVPEVLATIRSGKDTPSSTDSNTQGILQGCREVFQHSALAFRCGVIGAAIGILPGVGSAVGQWIAYGHANQSSKPRVPFGSGAIEGVIGPATATTAALGGALVPTLALGIPGGLVTSFLLSAMILKGVTPGPSMLVADRLGGHLTLVFALVWTVAIASAIGAAIGVASLGWVARLATLRPSRLFPIVLTFVLIGTLGERHAVADLAILLGLGAVGYAMARNGWPRPPLILGFVLGPLLERRVLLSQSLYGWAWVLRPGVLLLAGIVVFFLFGVIRSNKTLTSRKTTAKPRMWRDDLMISAGAAIVAAGGLVLCLSLRSQPAFFPSLTFGVTLVLALTQVAISLKKVVSGSDSNYTWLTSKTVVRLGWLVLFALNAWLFGLVAGTGVSTIIFMRTEGRESWLTTFTMTAALVIAVRLIVVSLMQMEDQGLLMWLITR